MKLGVLREQEPEKRVTILPDLVSTLLKLKLEVEIEKNAGQGAHASDADYTNAGASVKEKAAIFKECDLILKINPVTSEELKMVKKDQVITCVMNPFFNHDMVQSLAEKQATVFSLDFLPRTTRAQAMDILSSMATVSGYKAVIDAALNLPRFFPMFMSAAGTIKPAKMLILGAGVAGLQAIATARKLGAIVEVFDVRSAVKEEVQSLGGKFVEVEGAVEDKSAGGYAVEQTEEFKQKQAELIHKHAAAADIVICTAQIPGKKAPLLIRKETVESMKPGSVIVDLAASSGGNCELTVNGETKVVSQVTILGQTDYPSRLAIDASSMFGKNVLNFLNLLFDEEGKLNLNFEDEIIKGTCLCHKGEITNDRLK